VDELDDRGMNSKSLTRRYTAEDGSDLRAGLARVFFEDHSCQPNAVRYD
jgi:hypothetical protein